MPPKCLKDFDSSFEIFVDANIFIYNIADASNECTRFIEQCAASVFNASTSTRVIDEVIFKSMLIETETICINNGPTQKNSSKHSYLSNHRSLIQQLENYRVQTEDILEFFDVYSVTADILRISIDYIHKYLMFPSDAIQAATIIENEIRHVATCDADFIRFAEKNYIQVWKPQDVITS